MKQEINLIFPLVDSRFKPATHFTDLHINAYAEIGRLNKILDVKIMNISYFKRGQCYSVDISSLLQVVNVGLYDRIVVATESHAMKLFKEKPEKQSTAK